MFKELVEYKVGDERFDLFVATPEGPGRRPAVLVCHAWGGRTNFEEDRAERLGELGYVGAAIDLYGVGKRGHNLESNRALMTALIDKPAELRKRLNAALDQLRKMDAVDERRMGAIGFCFGGMCSLLMGRMGLPLRAVVSFHALLKVGEQLPGPIQSKMLVLHGQDDPMVSDEDFNGFAKEMKRIHADWRLHSFPGVKHSFTNPKANNEKFGTVYNEDADQRSWQEMASFLAAELG